MISYKQLSLKDIFADCQNKFDNDKYHFTGRYPYLLYFHVFYYPHPPHISPA